MTIEEILLGSGGAIIALMTLVQIAPIKINPWTAVIKALGRGLNADVLKDLDEVKKAQEATRERLEEHIKVDGKREADNRRRQILRFNNELLRNLPHTKEEFSDVMLEIDEYEKYCRDHPDYKNNRAGLAIENIKQTYKVRMTKHDFLI